MIKSILDNDLYKFTMQQSVLELFPQARATYKFKNRGPHKFTNNFIAALKDVVEETFPKLKLSNQEYLFLKEKCSYLKPQYLEYLKNYRYNPDELKFHLDKDDNLDLTISGELHKTILWEVPIMSIISEVFFNVIEKDWAYSFKEEDYAWATQNKKNILIDNGCIFADFGTRRRRNYNIQDLIVKQFSKSSKDGPGKFVGTSNVHLAMKYDVKPIGTMAHEWIMINSALEGLRNANYYALQNWVRVYNSNLGIALTDTYGTEAFLNNFNIRLSKLYDGVRHDSGDPIEFAEKIVNHYNKLNIDPTSKTIVFSDSLNPQKAVEINKYCQNKIKCSFGIGTNFTNDFEKSKALNMVIKLYSVNNIPVVKLSDDLGKETGEENALKVAKWTFFNEPV